jgi:hypothetical protein
MTASLRQVKAADFSPTDPPGHLAREDRAGINLALDAGNRALVQAVLLNYLWRSDEALSQLSAPIEVSAYRGRPRAIIASASLWDDKLRCDLDLRRNPATYALPEDAPAEWGRFLNYHRGLYESRLEGAVMLSFTGQAGITAADVLSAAREGGVPLKVLIKENRKDVQSLGLGKRTAALIDAALDDDKTVMLPSRPVMVTGAERLAWFEYDPVTGYIDGVFPSGKHQAISEYSVHEDIGKTMVAQGMSYLSSEVAGYYFTIATGLGHFYACLLDLEQPDKPCLGTPDVCGPARSDAVSLCKAWKNARTGFEMTTTGTGVDITRLLPWPGGWEELAGETCMSGTASGLKIFGCGN